MNNRLTGAALAVLAAVAAVPAAAQVNGISVADPAIALAGSQALQAAYGQIGTTFQAQRTQLEQLQQQRSTAIRQFDTDGNGQLSEAEQTAAQANTAAVQQVQGIDQQINTIQQPITRARVYVVEQVAQQLNTAIRNVVTAGNIQVILNPNSGVYFADPVDITDEIIAQLNTLAPTVSTAVPDGWQPSQQSVQLYQEVSEVLLQVAMAQQQQQAQQPATPVQGR
jgi:Skp family chaperone for outer membrane proteins